MSTLFNNIPLETLTKVNKNFVHCKSQHLLTYFYILKLYLLTLVNALGTN